MAGRSAGDPNGHPPTELQDGQDLRSLLILLAGLVIAGVVYLATSGHVIFLPILLVFPLGLLSWRRR